MHQACHGPIKAGLDILAAQAALQDQLLTQANISSPRDMLIIDGETRKLDGWCSEYEAKPENVNDRWLAKIGRLQS